MYPALRERRGGMGRLAWWVVWVLLIVYVVHHPGQAAALCRTFLAGIEEAGEAIATFLARTGVGQ